MVCCHFGVLPDRLVCFHFGLFSGCFAGGQPFEELQETLQRYAAESTTGRGPVFKVPEKNVLLKLLDTLGRNDRIIRSATRGEKLQGQSEFHHTSNFTENRISP